MHPEITVLIESEENRDLQWISAEDPQFTVDGLWWFRENGGGFMRLPRRAESIVRPPVWDLAQCPSGGRVRFRSDTPTLRLIIRHDAESLGMSHMCNVGTSGIDLYEGPPTRMTYWQSNRPTEPRAPYVCPYVAELSRQMRELTLYLPTYTPLADLYIGIDRDAELASPSAYRLAGPIVFYGTSITQGGCASRAATGFVPVVGRGLGVDVVNLGFSGNGKGEPEMARLVSEIDAACFVMDSVANMPPDLMRERYEAFVHTVREAHPEMPIVLMTRFNYGSENYGGTARIEAQNAVVLETCRRMKAQGDANVHLFESRDVIGLGGDHPSVDGAHLTDLGFRMMADALAPFLARVLALEESGTA